MRPDQSKRTLITTARSFSLSPTKITLRIRGDERFHWYEDLQGYTVVIDNGRYVYATLDAQGQLVRTALVVGASDPQAAGLPRGLRPSAQAQAFVTASIPSDFPEGVQARGSVKNLVVLCRFSDHTFGVHTRDPADYDVLFNHIGGDGVLAPTGSVKDYFLEASYGHWRVLPDGQLVGVRQLPVASAAPERVVQDSTWVDHAHRHWSGHLHRPAGGNGHSVVPGELRLSERRMPADRKPPAVRVREHPPSRRSGHLAHRRKQIGQQGGGLPRPDRLVRQQQAFQDRALAGRRPIRSRTQRQSR